MPITLDQKERLISQAWRNMSSPMWFQFPLCCPHCLSVLLPHSSWLMAKRQEKWQSLRFLALEAPRHPRKSSGKTFLQALFYALSENVSLVSRGSCNLEYFAMRFQVHSFNTSSLIHQSRSTVNGSCCGSSSSISKFGMLLHQSPSTCPQKRAVQEKKNINAASNGLQLMCAPVSYHYITRCKLADSSYP